MIAFKSESSNSRSNLYLYEQFLDQVVKHPADFVGRIPWKFTLVSTLFDVEMPSNIFKQISKIHTFWIDTNVDAESSADYESELSKTKSNSGLRKRPKCPNPSFLLHLLTQCNPTILFNFEYEFSREFYESLTSILSIKELNLIERFENLDWNLFLKLKYLRKFTMCTEKLPIDFISRMFELKFLREVKLNALDYWFYFDRHSAYFELKVTYDDGSDILPYQPEKCFDCLKDLVEELERLKANDNRLNLI